MTDDNQDARQWKRWDWLLTKAQDADLNDWEDRFVSDLLVKQDRQGIHFRLSEKQEEILERICEK